MLGGGASNGNEPSIRSDVDLHDFFFFFFTEVFVLLLLLSLL